MTVPPDPATDAETDSLDALLCAALDGTDQRRIALLTQLALIRLDVLRDEDLDRLRQDGIPPVFRL